jgi:hypothetical protein
VFSQTHKDYKVYLVGDWYEDWQQWYELVSPYFSDKLYVINLPEPGERNKYKDHHDALWCYGGTKAFNLAIDKAIEDGFVYIAHLDHDDWWEPNHLKVISDCIDKTGADYICTKSYYMRGRHMNPPQILPAYYGSEEMIDIVPLPGGVVNSSTVYNYVTIPIRGEDSLEIRGELRPCDEDLWVRINHYMVKHNLVGKFINKITCNHTEEGLNLR